ncbi:MAG: FAD-dependent oxidoreductase [Parvularculales bacterium]
MTTGETTEGAVGFVIVGGGQAAVEAIASLRGQGYEGTIILIGDEPYLPYQRPPLSKKYLDGTLSRERLYLRPEEFYRKSGVMVRLGETVHAIGRQTRTVVMGDGERLRYEKLLLTTGARARHLEGVGVDLVGVYSLRSIQGVDGLRTHFVEGARLVIVGGGYIGLEVAAIGVSMGLDVTVLEAAERVMARVVAPEVSRFYEAVHEEKGVSIKTGVALARIEGTNGCVTNVVDKAGRTYPADVVLVGVGASPNDTLAAEAGLVVDDGVVVDHQARTSDEAIFAAGDCTRYHSVLYNRDIRLESVQNAIEQARIAATAMCGGMRAYDETPWFWSDQYDLKLQIAGLSEGHDKTVMRGETASRSFALFYLKEGRLLAVDAVNRAPEFMVSRKFIKERMCFDPNILADENISMKEMAQRALQK